MKSKKLYYIKHLAQFGLCITPYEKDKTSISSFTLIKELPQMKKVNFEWLKKVDSTSL